MSYAHNSCFGTFQLLFVLKKYSIQYVFRMKYYFSLDFTHPSCENSTPFTARDITNDKYVGIFNPFFYPTTGLDPQGQNLRVPVSMVAYSGEVAISLH